jgi:hypothetical protein
MGKPVAIRLTAGPIAENALFLIETESQGATAPADRYAAYTSKRKKRAEDDKMTD